MSELVGNAGLAPPHFLNNVSAQFYEFLEKVGPGEPLFLVGARGFEPPISGPPARRSNQLSHAPRKALLPQTPAHACALPTALIPTMT